MGAEDIRKELAEYHTYLTLVLALNESENERFGQLREMMKAVANFIDTATARSLKEQGKQALQGLRQSVDNAPKFLPRKVPPRQIARDFIELCEHVDVWRNGIPYGWLQERFAIKGSLPIPPDLPPHAKVGIGIHAGLASVEEIFLLEDTYFLLAQAESAFNQLHAAANLLNGSSKRLHSGSRDYRTLSAINAQVGTFSRLSVVSAAAFVEAFVNSVGWSEAARGSHYSEDVCNQLRGKQKERYLSLETKLERFPKIIRADGIAPIVLSDAKQAKEPFISFLAETKEIRDASMHYAPGKAMIWRAPHEWYTSAQKAVEHAVDVAKVFWLACYPQRELPSYLNGLDHAALIEIARERARRVGCTESDSENNRTS